MWGWTWAGLEDTSKLQSRYPRLACHLPLVHQYLYLAWTNSLWPENGREKPPLVHGWVDSICGTSCKWTERQQWEKILPMGKTLVIPLCENKSDPRINIYMDSWTVVNDWANWSGPGRSKIERSQSGRPVNRHMRMGTKCKDLCITR